MVEVDAVPRPRFLIVVGGVVRLWRRGNRARRYAKLMTPRGVAPGGEPSPTALAPARRDASADAPHDPADQPPRP